MQIFETYNIKGPVKNIWVTILTNVKCAAFLAHCYIA